MGCDIHAYVEYEHANGRWELFARVYIGRLYDLFAFMSSGGNTAPS